MKISLHKRLNLADGHTALHVDAVFTPENCTALYGPSGAGKTSVLRMIAGLMRPEKGFIEVNGEIWLDTAKGISLPPQQRSIGFVFQDFALFPNMTVEENLRFASADAVFTRTLLALSGLENLAGSKPGKLSGGQKQRLALVRALARKPRVLLMDEPLSAQDAELRRNLWGEISTLLRDLRPTTILVSHDEAEIRALAATMIRLENGLIRETTTPDAFFGSRFHPQKLRMQGIIREIRPQNGHDELLVETSAGKILILADSGAHTKTGCEISFESDVLPARIRTTSTNQQS